MKNKLNWLLIVVVCLSVFGARPQTVYAQDPRPGTAIQAGKNNAPHVPGQMIVVFRKGYSVATMTEISSSIAESLSGTLLEVHDTAALLEVDKGIDIPTFTADFSRNMQAKNPANADALATIVYTQPNYIFDVPEPTPGGGGQTTPSVPRPNDNPDDETDNQQVTQTEAKQLKSTATLPTYPLDPLLFDSWGWWNTNTDVIWQDNSASPMICLLDTGVDGAHPDLAGRIVNGKDVVNNDNVPDDDNGHGTHVAGVMVAKANNKIGLAGVSNSKILAIKVLDFKGIGNSWDINYGIKLCADNPAVKIINMSFGTYPVPDPYTSGVDDFLYQALEYAIVTKGKLAIAAAGNYHTSDYTFPAAWAGDYVCRDGFLYTPPANCLPTSGDPAPNTISGGLIAVGASRSYWSSTNDGFDLYGNPHGTQDGRLWVDTNGDTLEITDPLDPTYWDEHFFPSDCAPYFSNYGAWVSLVAPGESITSTVPVSYPFYQQFRMNADPDGNGYDTWNGTSMAAPFVTGIAARVWSVGSSLFGGALTTNARVKKQLISTGYSLQTAVDPAFSPTNNGYYGTYSGEAPYCWPGAGTGPFNNMSKARMLNVANAMNRTSVYVYIYNALNGLPLKGASVSAYQGATEKSVGLINSNTSPTVVLPNLPRGKTYDIKVNKTGFTNGSVVIATLDVPTSYSYYSDSTLSVSIPPKDKITGVIDWIVYNPSSADLDLYAWLPKTAPNGSGLPAPNNKGGAVGYNLGGFPFIGRGRMSAAPFARSNLDMGFGISGAHAYEWAATESISIMPRPGFPTMPYYNTNTTNYYDFLVHEFSPGALDSNEVYFRLWVGGNIKATVHKDNTIVCGAKTWWKPGIMRSGNFILKNICVNGGPY